MNLCHVVGKFLIFLDRALATTTTGASDSQPADPPDSASTLAHCLPLFLKAKSAGYPQPQTIRNLGRFQPDLQNHDESCVHKRNYEGLRRVNQLSKKGGKMWESTCLQQPVSQLGSWALQQGKAQLDRFAAAKSARTAGAEALHALRGSSCNSQ